MLLLFTIQQMASIHHIFGWSTEILEHPTTTNQSDVYTKIEDRYCNNIL
jgi:hypothetical protein